MTASHHRAGGLWRALSALALAVALLAAPQASGRALMDVAALLGSALDRVASAFTNALLDGLQPTLTVDRTEGGDQHGQEHR